VDNVRALRRLASGSALYTGGVAAEPGLDYRTMDVEGFNGPTEVTVIDYSSRRCSTPKKMRMFEDFQAFFEYDRPKWSKVRWINVDGLNWPCIKLLASKYNLHRLAIEDLLSVQRTKMDLYSDRMTRSCRELTIDTYVCLLLHVLIGDDDQIVIDDEDAPSISSRVEERTPDPSYLGKLNAWFKGSKTDDMVRDAETAAGMEERETLNVTPIAQHYHPDRKYIHDKVNSTRATSLTVAVEQVSIFLTSDGTVITFFQVIQFVHLVDFSNLVELLKNPFLNDLLQRLRFFAHLKTRRYCYTVLSMPW
jgi:Mg2+ and Co2+ transporter CorA